jgi:hypothetical protein
VLVRRGWVKERKLILFEKETSIDLLWYCSLRTAVRVDICAALNLLGLQSETFWENSTALK